ncbi:MAG: patatin-like phospholipase family protein [Syntrophomonas sp.]|nr:patatin-like phospholipase family protein [Syntrophomonas sp.]
MKSLGLALGGGGLKGLAHIGVLQVLCENDIRPVFISGTSAGSIIAALYASGISPYRIETIVTGLTSNDYLDYNVMGMFKYFLNFLIPGYKYNLDGILVGDKIEKLIYDLTKGKYLMEIKMPLAIISCDIDSGSKIIFTNQPIKEEADDVIVIHDALLSEAVRSSISIPVTFQPKVCQGMQMVDGGLKDIVPVMVNKYMGASYVLAINLGKEIYQTKVNGIPQTISRAISIMVFETSNTEERFFADMLLFPDVPDVGLNDMQNAPQIIRAGRRIMRENIAALKKGLGK